ncbi:MAG TPA: hypothetical protein PLZ93_12845 [Nocardioides sp.]|uniref:hypothetical protein n=1 Tax=uncultured Nocardioides sp. TaxID=198441 RepID=UPI00261F8DF7|nr:hypothetical protein [uncultured Nocardioides sp.]HRD60572.1 hypothetical protein [Nocardioides sp.]HRI96498.1 hypothetical protein [Nocardioides sp.]HRK46118.1 hypothetical protein [Nocardioides sp.]
MKSLPVTEEQVFAARLLIKFEGGPEHVDPLIVAIAESQPMSEAEVEAAFAALEGTHT